MTHESLGSRLSRFRRLKAKSLSLTGCTCTDPARHDELRLDSTDSSGETCPLSSVSCSKLIPMNPPEFVDIGPYRWQIVFSLAEIKKVRKIEKDDSTVGYLDVHTQRIVVDPTQSPDMIFDTLLHECLHATWLAAGATELPDSLTEEQIVSIMSPGLLLTMRRNPQLVRYLFPYGD